MEIPQQLVTDIGRGRVVLVLGAGASIGAIDAKGRTVPTGPGLARELADEFLSGAHHDAALSVVAELCVSEADLTRVQEFIRQRFEGLEPAPFHLLLASFRWRGIATTNYDLVVERAYQRADPRAQELVPFISDRERVDEKLRTPDALALLKLHGCVTRTTDSELPLILSIDQYVTHKHGRERLFTTLWEWCFEYPVVFIGQSLQDSDLRQILLSVDRQGSARPRYYIVAPSLSDQERRMWESRRVSPIEGTLKEFLESLDGMLQRGIRAAPTDDLAIDHPVANRFTTSHPRLSPSTLQFLLHKATYVHEGMPVEPTTPTNFYRGMAGTWGGIAQHLDIPRKSVDTFIAEVILADEKERSKGSELYALKAEAGAGKTIALRRAAWEAAISFEKLCFWWDALTPPEFEPLRELHQATGERIFLFVDNAADHIAGLAAIAVKARQELVPVTIVTAERINEWNIYCARLDQYLTRAYPLTNLSHREIVALIGRLEKHGSLGQLERASEADRIAAFSERAGRQLLVALHEATLGKPLEEILVDEFNQIEPEEARRVYLSVCVLNRLEVPVRAGVISRVHGIPFSDFEARLFKPLEHVVEVRRDPILRDMLYEARHPLVAQMVFENVLLDKEERFSLYVRLLGALNVSYSTDRTAFRQMVRGRVVLELFPDLAEATELYRVATEVAQDDGYLFQQMAIHEMNRPNGNLATASARLAKARELLPRDTSILHSTAELTRRRAERARTPLERDELRREARDLAAKVRDEPDGGSAGYDTLLKLSLDRLRELLDDASSSSMDLESAISRAEQDLDRGLQRFPGDPTLLAREAELASLLGDQERVVTALQAAFASNHRASSVAVQLSQALARRGDDEGSVRVLKEVLNANPADKQVNARLARRLMNGDAPDIESIIYYARRSYTDGDQNYDAQFWYAAWLFVRGRTDDLQASAALFAKLRNLPQSHDRRTGLRWAPVNLPQLVDLAGRIARLQSTFGWVTRDGPADDIFFHESNSRTHWGELRREQRVKFSVGFTLSGPVAIDLHVE